MEATGRSVAVKQGGEVAGVYYYKYRFMKSVDTIYF